MRFSAESEEDTKMLRIRPENIFAIACFMGGIGVGQETNLARGRFVISGYGDTLYADQGDQSGNTSNRFIPIFLFRISDQLHVEAELEGSINGDGEFELELEYSDIHYYAGKGTTITAGKFLLPVGQFGPNLHPSWINKLPTSPAIYGHHEGGILEPVLPILSDVGVAIQQVFRIAQDKKIFLDVFMSQGPRLAGDHDDDEHGKNPIRDEDEHDEGGGPPELEFDATANDNNSNKAVGGRAAYAMLPNLELGYSYYTAAYDDQGELDYSAQNLDLNYIGTHWQLRGEYLVTDIDARIDEEDDEHDEKRRTEDDEHGFELQRFERNGWYLQASLQLGAFNWAWLNPVEVVFRYSEINKTNEGDQWIAGINYWLGPTSVVKVGYQNAKTDLEESDTLLAQFSYGF